jgi:hypothetical protein
MIRFAPSTGSSSSGALDGGAVSIGSRLRRLEERQGGGGCPECGLAPDERRPMAVIEQGVPWKGSPSNPDERCAYCGRSLNFVIEVVYDSPAIEEGGGGLT